MAECRIGRGGRSVQRGLFWKVPLPPECILFVDSPDSEPFARLLEALEKSTIIAIDAEWKPVFERSATAAPRVSVLQIACRSETKLRKKLLTDYGRSVQTIPNNTKVEYTKARLASSELEAESASSLRREEDRKNSGEVIAQMRGGIESDSDTGREPIKEEIQGQSVVDNTETGNGSSEREWLLTTTNSTSRSVRNEEKVNAAGQTSSPKLDYNALENAQDSTVRPCRSPAESPKSGLSSSLSSGSSLDDEGAEDEAEDLADMSVPEGGDNSRRIVEEMAKDESPEMIFLLDLLTLPVLAFGEVLREVFVDASVLKIGFGFKQDLVNLQGTFRGPQSCGCFDKVEPYLDVGKLFRHLQPDQSPFTHRGKRLVAGGDGLAAITKTVLGLHLAKDMQCSNWEQRPLSSGQLDYAAADAYCLLAIFDALQVKAAESWFSPIVAGDDDEENFPWSGPKVGLAGLLTPPANRNHLTRNICQPERGNATLMVEAALEETGHTRHAVGTDGRKTLFGVEALVRRLGETLLMGGGGDSVTSKRVRRKTRNRRAREAGKTNKELQDDEVIPYVGPPPWDRACGGDGIPKFLCDAMVEGLARQLRCVGIDAASLNSRKCEPRELVDLAEKDGRIILTKDVKLLRRRLVPTDLAYRVKRQGKWDQLAEVIEVFELSINEDQLLTRCTKCNGNFAEKPLTAEEAVAQRPWNQVIPARVLENVNEFWQCSECKHVYWQGSQFTRAYQQFAAICHTEKSVD